MTGPDSRAAEARIDRYETEQRERQLDDDAAARVQDRYERTTLGWGTD